jgi:hypothetical protein
MDLRKMSHCSICRHVNQLLIRYEWSLLVKLASPRVCQTHLLSFISFGKTREITPPTIWQMTWQILVTRHSPAPHAHICALALTCHREISRRRLLSRARDETSYRPVRSSGDRWCCDVHACRQKLCWCLLHLAGWEVRGSENDVQKLCSKSPVLVAGKCDGCCC